MIDTGIKYTTNPTDGYQESYQLFVYEWERSTYDLTDDWDLETIAEKCADDYRDNCDGWELTGWNNGTEPLTVFIWTDPEHKVQYEVFLEWTPTYTAVKVEQDKPL